MLSFVDLFVEAGAVYTYRLVAVGGNGLSSTPVGKVAEVPRVLAAPLGVQPMYVAENQVQLTWSIAEGEAPAGFTILRDGVEVGESATTFFVDASVAADKGYRYTVRAFSSAKARVSSESAPLAVQTLRPGAPPIQSITTIIRQNPPAPTTSAGAKPPTNTATLSLTNGSNANYCLLLSGTADLATGKSILTAHRRVNNPPDGTYYFHRGSVAGDLKSWTGREYLGEQLGQKYEVYVLVMDTGAADLFWSQHLSGDKSYAFANSLPVAASDTKAVTQSTKDNCS